MSFRLIAEKRYTTKQYNPLKKVPSDKLHELKEILRLSPSSINSQPWRFHVVSNPEIQQKLAEASYTNTERVRHASHLFVFNVITDLDEFEKQIESYLSPAAVNFYQSMVKPLPKDQILTWLSHQVYISLGFFLGACASMGIDSTPMEGIDRNAYASILNLEGYIPLFAVAIGYRDINDSNQPTITEKSRRHADSVFIEV